MKTVEPSETNAPANDGAGLSTGLISLLPGQSVRVAAVNVGGKEINGEFLFVPVTEQGKAGVPIRCNLIVASGDAAFEKLTHPGGVNRMLLYVQIRVRQNRNDIKHIVPSLEIFDEQANRSIGLLHGSDFASIGPIFNPPFAREN